MVGKREKRFANEVKEKSPDFGNREGNHHRKIRRQVGLNKVGLL
jgi:hypothetical protein